MDFTADVSQLNTLAVDLAGAGIKATAMAEVVVRKTVADVEATAKTLAPVDTGNLRSSIGHDMLGPLEAEVGPTANYGAHVEFGTVTQAPQAFMGPALDRHSPDFVTALALVAGNVL